MGQFSALRFHPVFVLLARLSAAVVVLNGTAAERFSMQLTVDTGFFERRDALVAARLDFRRPVDISTAVLRDPANSAIPFWFEPVAPFRGRLYWILAGETDSLEKVPFSLVVQTGRWPGKPTGTRAIAKIVRRRRNLLPNGGFETPDLESKQTTTWKGARGAAHWVLHDFAWSYRKLPDIAALCRPVTVEAFEGKWALMFRSDVREDAPKARTGIPVVVAPYVNGPVVPMAPGRRYAFSYWVKFTDVIRDGYVSASVNFLDANKKRLFPRKYAINRMQAAYGTARNLRDDYLGKWVCVSVVKEALPEVRFGQVVIGGSFGGTCFLDGFRLREVGTGPPATVSVGPLQPVE
ncbi:MAG: hypothetical protein GXP31_05060 [Kiritimatiellaeota bacterium]|nr:hypothetical protein [Kiritimatiellota bacterium]